MDAYVLARVLHVLAVIHWIGGVAMVTLVILPQMRALPPADRIATFERLEGRFGGQAKLGLDLAAIFVGHVSLLMSRAQRGVT